METSSIRLEQLERQNRELQKAIAVEKKKERERQRRALRRREAKTGEVVLKRAADSPAFAREIAALMAGHVPETQREDWPELFGAVSPVPPSDMAVPDAAVIAATAERENGASRGSIFAGLRGGS